MSGSSDGDKKVDTTSSSTSSLDSRIADEPLYLTYAQQELHPSRIGAAALLSGFSPAPVSQCRVLELGCGDGGNLIPLAEAYPQSSFTGVDIDARSIHLAQSRASSLHLTNVTFTQSDISDYNPTPKGFDYIICHGLYSWVPASVRTRALELVNAALSDRGLALVSYNVLPGWRQRGVLRDIMKFGVELGRTALGKTPEEFLSGEDRLRAGAQFLTFVSGLRQGSEDNYGAYLKEAISRLQHADLPYLVHEYLGEYNEPCSFLDFTAECEKRGLSFIGEARPAMMFSEDLGERAATFLTRSTASPLQREQALDYFRNRMFRETILCRSDALRAQGKEYSAFALRELPKLLVSTEYAPALPLAQIAHRSEVPFVNVITGREIEVEGGAPALALALVGARARGGVSIAGLQAEAAIVGIPGLDKIAWGEILLKLLALGTLEIWSEEIAVQGDKEAPAKVRGFTRMMAQEVLRSSEDGEGGSVTTASHRTLPLSLQECVLLAHASEATSISQLAQLPSLQQEIPKYFDSTDAVAGVIDGLTRKGFFC